MKGVLEGLEEKSEFGTSLVSSFLNTDIRISARRQPTQQLCMVLPDMCGDFRRLGYVSRVSSVRNRTYATARIARETSSGFRETQDRNLSLLSEGKQCIGEGILQSKAAHTDQRSTTATCHRGLLCRRHLLSANFNKWKTGTILTGLRPCMIFEKCDSNTALSL